MGGGGGGGGGSYLSGFDLEFCTCKHAPPRGDLGACSPRKFLEDTCSEINTETANFEPNIMLQSDKRQKKKKKTLTCKYCSKEGDGHSFERAPTSATRCPRSDVFTATRCPRRK